ncbi:MAG: AbrB/MazE/SpoVT family DNA-binding domain-containing protein [Candidatus Sulfotelmatobacter sp.]
MTTLTVDKAGRVVLPKPVRDELQLSAGDSLELESSEDQIVLRPVRNRVGMRKKQGIWVLDLDEPISAAATNRVLRDIRREREQAALGRPQFKARSAKRGKLR